MVWSEKKDLAMLHEIAAEGVMQQKSKSRDRGTAWQVVVNNLNPLPGFDVTSRSVRDRFNSLSKKHKINMAKQERATGGGGEELTEVESIIEELALIGEETEKKMEEESTIKKDVAKQDKGKAVEMRKRAMETMGETQRRLGEEGNAGKKRRTTGQSMDWLKQAILEKKETTNQERAEREEEKRHQHEQQQQFMQQLQASQFEQSQQSKLTEQHLLQQIGQQQQQQQQQSQQFALVHNQMVMLMEQQSKQTDMLIKLFKKSN